MPDITVQSSGNVTVTATATGGEVTVNSPEVVTVASAGPRGLKGDTGDDGTNYLTEEQATALTDGGETDLHSHAAGGGDMLAATYDPTTKEADAFDMAQMAEAADAKVLTAAERAAITANSAKVTNATHSGDATGSGALTIANDAVTNAKAANMAQATIKGRQSGAGTGDPEDLTPTQARTILAVEENADVTDETNACAGLAARLVRDPTVAPQDTDRLALYTGSSINRMLWSTVKSQIKLYFDTLYEVAGTMATHLSAFAHGDIATAKAHADTVTGNPHALDSADVGADAAGTASGLIGTHESTYAHGDIATNTAARHTQGTDQGLDTGGANAVTAAQAKAGYTHSGVTSGNPHSVTAADAGADATGTAAGLMSTHTTTHPAPTSRDTRNEAADAAIQAHVTATSGNPHSVTAADVGVEANADVTDAANVGSAIGGTGEDATPADADKFAQTGGTTLAHTTWGTIKSLLTTVFNALYAPIGEGVTNGDSHDHAGGDGAQIDHTGLANIGSNAHSVIDTHLGASAPHSGHVDTSGNETIAGEKTFSTFPITPSAAPDADYEVANKKYVDDNGGASSSDDYLHYQDVQAAGTQSGTFTFGAWRRRVLNTEAADTGGHGSLASNQITLAAGTYRVFARCPAFEVNNHRAILYDTTGAAVLRLGSAQYSDGTASESSNDSIIMGRFTIGVQSVIELRHWCATTRATYGLGARNGQNDSLQEVFAEIELWKEQ